MPDYRRKHYSNWNRKSVIKTVLFWGIFLFLCFWAWSSWRNVPPPPDPRTQCDGGTMFLPDANSLDKPNRASGGIYCKAPGHTIWKFYFHSEDTPTFEVLGKLKLAKDGTFTLNEHLPVNQPPRTYARFMLVDATPQASRLIADGKSVRYDLPPGAIQIKNGSIPLTAAN